MSISYSIEIMYKVNFVRTFGAVSLEYKTVVEYMRGGLFAFGRHDCAFTAEVFGHHREVGG